MSVRISFLGGVGEIGKNMTAFEFEDEIVIIDCGAAFPSGDMPGVDLVIPSFEYLQANKHKIAAVLLTHGHEDHIGALPHFLKEFPNVPVYGTKLTLTLLENKFREHKIENAKLNVVTARTTLKFRHFSAEFIKISHSIAGSCALALFTPVGTIFHTGDFKIDYTPVDNVVTDLSRIAEIGKNGVALLMSDSTNAERSGFSMSEKRVGQSLNSIFAENSERRIFIATFSSNIHRVQQIVDVANRYGRKVFFAGRSMINVADCARRIGELRYDNSQVDDIEKLDRYDDKKVCVISTGSQGEPMSALTRMAADEFYRLQIGANDTIIISATPIPGNEKMVYNVINNLYRKGARVIYESLAEVHVSGHACQEELKLMMALLKPENFVPVHGEFRQQKKHAELAVAMGVDPINIRIAELGSCFELGRHLKVVDDVPASAVLIDGDVGGDVGNLVLRDRINLSEDGIVIVAFSHEKVKSPEDIQVLTRGFVHAGAIDEIVQDIRNASAPIIFQNKGNNDALIATLRKELRNLVRKKLRRQPMIIVMIV